MTLRAPAIWSRCGNSINDEHMEVAVLPSHNRLDGGMKAGERERSWQDKSPPDRRLEVKQLNLELNDLGHGERFAFLIHRPNRQSVSAWPSKPDPTPNRISAPYLL